MTMRYIVLFAIVLLSFFVVYHEFGDFRVMDPILRESMPYVSKIHPINSTIGLDCTSKECFISSVYDYVISNYHYIEDPNGTELIRSPEETMRLKGGDCEDLTILLNSLLVGIKTYIVLTDTHAYSLACGIDIKRMEEYVKKFIIRNAKKSLGNEDYDVKIIDNDLFIIKSKDISKLMNRGSVFYYGGDGSKLKEPLEYLNIKYNIHSDKPIDLYFVPDSKQYERIAGRKPFKHFNKCSKTSIIDDSGQCDGITQNAGVVIVAKARTRINLRLEYYYAYEDDSKITYYNINNQTCIVLDPTAGELGYPGYDNNLVGRKIATDGKTYFYLS